MDDAKLLAPNSTIITTTSHKRSMWMEHSNALVMQSALDDQDNPFLRFASYILIHPDTLSFGLITNDGTVKKFIAPIEHIEVIQNNSSHKLERSPGFYTPESIEAYQQRYISSFIKYLDKNREFVSSEKQIKISQCIDMVTKEEWWNKNLNRERYLSRLDTPLMLRRNTSNIDAITSTATRYPEQIFHKNFMSQSPSFTSNYTKDGPTLRDGSLFTDILDREREKRRQSKENQITR